jgi:HK97 family phage major capsid protein
MSAIEQLQSKKDAVITHAKQLAYGEGTTEEIKSLMEEARSIDERIETIKSLGEFQPVVTKTPVDDTPWKSGFNIIENPFSGDRHEKNLKAYVLGRFAQHIAGNKKATEWLKSQGHIKAMGEGTTTAGGFLTPDLLNADLIYLREKFGVARRNASIVPMYSDVQLIPNTTANTVVYYPGENTAGTLSDMAFSQISLTAKKMVVLTQVSSELREDAVVDIGSKLAMDMAWSIAKEEDRIVFASAATSTDASGLVGMNRALTDLASGVAVNYPNVAGIVVGAAGTNAALSAFTLQNFQSLCGRMPTYAMNPKWYMHKDVFFNGIADKLIALSGNAILDIQNAYTQSPTLFGYPIEWVQNMPRAAAANACVAYFADLSVGVKFGDRRGVSIEMSDQRYFLEDALAFKATERISFSAFDVGNYNAAAASRVPGSVCAVFCAP